MPPKRKVATKEEKPLENPKNPLSRAASSLLSDLLEPSKVTSSIDDKSWENILTMDNFYDHIVPYNSKIGIVPRSKEGKRSKSAANKEEGTEKKGEKKEKKIYTKGDIE